MSVRSNLDAVSLTLKADTDNTLSVDIFQIYYASYCSVQA